MKKYAVIAIVMLLIPFMAFANGAAEEEKTEYVFATDATWPPFEYIDENGNLTGFEVELVPMIGEAIGGKNHSTINYSISLVEKKMRNEPSFKNTVFEIINNLQE